MNCGANSNQDCTQFQKSDPILLPWRCCLVFTISNSIKVQFLREDKRNDKIFHITSESKKPGQIPIVYLIILWQNFRIPTIVGWCRLSVNVPNCSLIFWQKREVSHVQRKSKNLGPYVVRRRIDVLWCRPIKLIQVVSTSELDEYWWKDIDFIFFSFSPFSAGPQK